MLERTGRGTSAFMHEGVPLHPQSIARDAFRKAPAARQSLAQRVSAGYYSRHIPSAVGAAGFLQSECLEFINQWKLHPARYPGALFGQRFTEHEPRSNYTPNFSFFLISAAIFSISAWINPFVANIVLPPST
jgi:hypothetical protein